MGVLYEGYCSDFTRTLYLGKADQEFKKYYEIVKTAWFKAFERVKTGVPVYEIDKRIREYFQKKEFFPILLILLDMVLELKSMNFHASIITKAKNTLRISLILRRGWFLLLNQVSIFLEDLE